MEGIVYINGNYCKASEAKVSIFDRGFTFGDAVYEVIPVYQGKTRFISRHITRLSTNLANTRIPLPELNWHLMFETLAARNGGGDMQIYLQITRGNQGERKHDIPKTITPTVVAYTLHNPYPIIEEQIQGLSAQLIEDIRWLRCDIKTTAMLGNVLLNDDAVRAGSNTSILYRDGMITEGSTSNVFIVDSQGMIRTPAENHLCLPGITRQLVLELLKDLNIPFKENPISIDELMTAREVWITSTTKEIYPVTTVDGVKIASGAPYPVWQKVNQAFQHLIQSGYE